MSKKTKSSILLLSIASTFIFMIMTFQSFASPVPYVSGLSEDMYLFVDTHIHTEGVGDVGPQLLIDFPTYSFSRNLISYVPIDNYSSRTKVIIGSGRSLSGTAGGGAATYLNAYNDTYKLDSFYFDQDKTLHMLFNGSYRTVKAGQTWSETIEQKPSMGNGKLLVTYSIENHGLQYKVLLQQPTPIPVITATTSSEKYTVSGYIKSDIELKNFEQNSGFIVRFDGLDLEAQTDDDGNFIFNNVPTITNGTLQIIKAGYLPRTISNITVKNNIGIGTQKDPLVMLSGDINNDGAVNMNDVIIIARVFNLSSKDSNYDRIADLNRDASINMSDVMIVAKYFGFTTSDYSVPLIYEVTGTPVATSTLLPSQSPTPTQVTSQSPSPTSSNEATFVESTELHSTLVTTDSEEKIPFLKNVIYCPTFQMAWDELKGLMGGDVQLTGNPPLVDTLNKGFSMDGSLSADSYYKGAGFGQATVDKMNEELKSKFNDSAPQISEKLMPDDIIAYSLLLKNLSFAKTFDTSSIKFASGERATNVKAFGVAPVSKRSEELSKQVLVYDYLNDNNFIIKLLTDNDKDEIILAKVEPSETLYKTYDSVMKRMSTSPKKHDIRDSLQIPVVSFNIGRDYTPTLPGTVMNEGFEGYYFKKAYQRTKFVLDENGAKLASEAIILLPSSVYTPKNLVFNKSFLLVMKEKNADKPYLMVWVDNPELLIQAK